MQQKKWETLIYPIINISDYIITKVNWGLEGTLDIHGNSKTRRGIHFTVELYLAKNASTLNGLNAIMEFAWISEVPSNPQLTLVGIAIKSANIHGKFQLNLRKLSVHNLTKWASYWNLDKCQLTLLYVF